VKSLAILKLTSASPARGGFLNGGSNVYVGDAAFTLKGFKGVSSRSERLSNMGIFAGVRIYAGLIPVEVARRQVP
jgi:hypothetical protein